MITIRPATNDDVESVRALVGAALSDASGPDEMTTQVNSGLVRVAVDGTDHGVAGCMLIRPLDDHLFVRHLVVASRARGRGVAGQLLLHAEAYAITLGLQEVRLAVAESPGHGLAYVLRHGFEESNHSAGQLRVCRKRL